MSGEQGTGSLGPLALIKWDTLRKHKVQLPCVQMTKPRLREAWRPAQGHTEGGGGAGAWPGRPSSADPWASGGPDTGP